MTEPGEGQSPQRPPQPPPPRLPGAVGLLAGRVEAAVQSWRVRRRAERVFRRGSSIASMSSLMGLPMPLIVLGLVAALIIGAALAYSLSVATSISAPSLGSAGGFAGDEPAGTNPTVVTESTLGIEVQQVLDAGSMQTAADFDVLACLRSQHVEGSVLGLEEIAWGSSLRRSWLVVHATTPMAQLHSSGGTVGVSIITPQCGAGTGASPLLWSGSTIVSPSP